MWYIYSILCLYVWFKNNNVFQESRLFLTRFTVQGPYEANIQKVGNSVKDVQPFENPVQYDHRGVSS